MIPLHDFENNRYEMASWMTVSLIFLNALIFAYEALLRFGGDQVFYSFIWRFGFTPGLMMARQGAGAWMSIAATFLHGSFYHLIGNMFFLWTFGPRLEDVCGPWRFLLYYLTCGVLADLVTTIVDPGGMIPGIGASGAIAGVMGAYFLLFPGSRIRTVLLIGFWPVPLRIRAFWFILLWVAFEIPPAMDILFNQTQYHVGHWAHLGGFFAAVLIFFFVRPEVFQRFINGAPIS